MTMQELSKKSAEELEELALIMAERGNMRALGLINEVREYAHKRVVVVKGRKVPVGTEGEVFWMGSRDYSKYGDPWGIYTYVRVGIRTDSGDVHWTDVNNIKVIE